MNTLQLYVPLFGLGLVIFGAIRIFIKADLTDGGRRTGSSVDGRDHEIRGRLFNVLLGPGARLELAAIVAGCLILVVFVGYTGLL